MSCHRHLETPRLLPRRSVCSLKHPRCLVHGRHRGEVGTQRLLMREERAPLQAGQRGSGKSEMMRHDAAVIGEKFATIFVSGGSITVVDRTDNEGIAHHHSPMLVTSVNMMVIIHVGTRNLYGKLRRGIMIDRAALVGSTDELVHHAIDYGVLRRLHLKAEEHVAPSVLDEHLRMVLEIMVEIRPCRPSVGRPVERKVPRPQLVSLNIGKVTVVDITATRYERMPERFQSCRHLFALCNFLRAPRTLPDVPHLASKLRHHFQPEGEVEWKAFGVSEPEIRRLAVVEHTTHKKVCSLSAPTGKIFGPVSVGHHAVGCVCLQPNHAGMARNVFPFRYRQPQLGHGACIV